MHTTSPPASEEIINVSARKYKLKLRITRYKWKNQWLKIPPPKQAVQDAQPKLSQIVRHPWYTFIWNSIKIQCKINDKKIPLQNNLYEMPNPIKWNSKTSNPWKVELVT